MIKVGEARVAVARGREALRAGHRIEAVRWLDRAHRLLPKDPSISLLLASALAGIHDVQSRSILLELLEEYAGFREARIALAAAEMRLANYSSAAERLSAMLTSTAPPSGPGFRQLANVVARSSGAPGWVGADSRGRLLLSIADPQQDAGVEISLDGTALWVLKPSRQSQGWIARSLPPDWKEASRLTAIRGGRVFLGSAIDLAALRRTQGYVQRAGDGGLEGWAWLPGDPDATARLELIPQESLSGDSSGPVISVMAANKTIKISSDDGTASPRGFKFPARKLPDAAMLRLVGTDGRDLLGSPVFLGAEQRATRAAVSALQSLYASNSRLSRNTPLKPDPWRPLPADGLMESAGPIPKQTGDRRTVPPRAPVDVVVPVYRGARDFMACLDSLLRSLPSWARVVVVDDASPDPDLRDAVDAAFARGAVTLLRHGRNQGFPIAANTGMRHAAADPRTPRDVVLLNADTLVPVRWIDRLVEAAYSSPDVGSVTPMTNDATILSYPKPNETNAAPDLSETDRLDRLFRRCNNKRLIDLPTAVGFCMFIRHDCLAEVGVFREDVFAQGYGEENDWSLRGQHLGWRNVAATGVFVAHLGGRSFGAAKQLLMTRNGQALNRLHPGYDALVSAFVARDPLALSRRRVDMLRWRKGRSTRAVVLVTHALGGGVERHLKDRCSVMRGQGIRPIVIRPVPGTAMPDGDRGQSCVVSDGMDQDYPNLRFAMPSELEALRDLLQADRPERMEVHHLLGHAPDIVGLSSILGVPYDMIIHDYGLWCPRVTLCTRDNRYCGEPVDVTVCEDCVADVGRRTLEDIPVAALRTQSGGFLQSARRVVTSCDDVAARVGRHFPGISPMIAMWEDESLLLGATLSPPPVPYGDEALRILVLGAIGEDKGYEVLLACVRDAGRRSLPLSFVVVGHTVDDSRLLDAGPIFITGAFGGEEGVDLARAQQAHLGFIPSVCPETWCYALSTLWLAGLRVAAFNLGAQAERISRSGRGALLPLGLGPSRVNDALIELASASIGLQAAGPAGIRAAALTAC